MAFFLLVRSPIRYRLPPRFYHPLPIIGMKHALPTLALHFFLSETLEGQPLRVEEIQRAIGWTTPDLLWDCVDNQTKTVFTLAQCFVCPLAFGNLFSKRLVD